MHLKERNVRKKEMSAANMARIEKFSDVSIVIFDYSYFPEQPVEVVIQKCQNSVTIFRNSVTA